MDGYRDKRIDKCGKCYTPCLRQGEALGNFVWPAVGKCYQTRKSSILKASGRGFKAHFLGPGVPWYFFWKCELGCTQHSLCHPSLLGNAKQKGTGHSAAITKLLSTTDTLCRCMMKIRILIFLQVSYIFWVNFHKITHQFSFFFLRKSYLKPQKTQQN